MNKAEKEIQVNNPMTQEVKKKCGVVMPISAIDDCDISHWQEVLSIVKDAIIQADFEGELVSLSADVGVIHRRIVQNLYENPVVVCDVSGKNPNVMFKLGLRLAFDKPTIIIKDDMTDYSFDTSPIEHLEYPRSLRFSHIVDFKQQLKEKIIATYERSICDDQYSPFLKHFGNFKVAKIDDSEVSVSEFLVDQIEDLKKMIFQQHRSSVKSNKDFLNSRGDIRNTRVVTFSNVAEGKAFLEKALDHNQIANISQKPIKGELVLTINFEEGVGAKMQSEIMNSILNSS